MKTLTSQINELNGRIQVYEEVKERYLREKEMNDKLKKSSVGSSDKAAYLKNGEEDDLENEKSLVMKIN